MIEILKAISDTNRLRIINLLRSSELCVCELETLLEMSQSNVSKHLKLLSDVKIVSCKKDAQWTYYYLCEDFKTQCSNLVKYLFDNFDNENSFKSDRRRFEKYNELSLSCAMIRQDKEDVLERLENRDE